MRIVGASLLGLSMIVSTATLALGSCDPESADRQDVANARASVAANCDCAGTPSHSAYVKCAVHQANTVLQNRSCASAVRRCAASRCAGAPAS